MTKMPHSLCEFVETEHRCFAVAFVDERESAIQSSERVIVGVENDLAFRQRRRRIGWLSQVVTHR